MYHSYSRKTDVPADKRDIVMCCVESTLVLASRLHLITPHLSRTTSNILEMEGMMDREVNCSYFSVKLFSDTLLITKKLAFFNEPRWR